MRRESVIRHSAVQRLLMSAIASSFPVAAHTLSFCIVCFSPSLQHTLDTARELLLSLQDELEHYNDPHGLYAQDGYLLLKRFSPPRAAEPTHAEKRRTRKKRDTTKRATIDAEGAKLAAAAAATATQDSIGSGSFGINFMSAALGASSPSSVAGAGGDEDAWEPIAMEARFAAMAEPDLLLLWANYQLRAYHYRPVPNYDEFQQPLSKRIMQPPLNVANFAGDLSGPRNSGTGALLMLLEHVLPTLSSAQSMNYLLHQEFESDLRIKGMLGVLNEVAPDLADVLNHDQILLAKTPDLMAAFIAKLFCAYPNLHQEKNG